MPSSPRTPPSYGEAPVRAQLEGVCHEVQFGPNTADLQYGLQSGIGLNGPL